jgi:hypothetical protein
MKKFLQKAIIFSILPTLILAASILLRRIHYMPYIMNNNIQTIVIGDSHPEVTIDDSRHESLQNLCVSSEGYIFTYYKLSELLKNNQTIQHVVLGFSYHNISSYFDEYIYGSKAHVAIRRYADLLDVNLLFYLVNKNPKLLIPTIKNMSAAKQNPYVYIGRYNGIGGDYKYNRESSHKRINFQYYDERGMVLNTSTSNIKYLYKIISLCEENGVSVTLLNTPLHDYYIDLIPEIYIDKYNTIIQEVSKRDSCMLFDFLDLELQDHHFLPDGDHLNLSGSIVATDFFYKFWKPPTSNIKMN